MSRAPSHTDIELFRELLAERLGLRFEEDKSPQLARVLADRARETSARDVADYLRRIAPDETELGHLATQLSVGETYFLRNVDQFHAFVALIRRHAECSPGALRVLSAGCSTGEEAYSVAIMVREALGDVDHRGLSILGIDVDPGAIHKARAARYSAWSLRETPETLRRRYFKERRDGYELDDTVRRMVRFEQRNLARADAELWRPGAFDVVFCRNVLMYFTQDAARGVVERIAHSLGPEGHLFLGHAENLRGLSHDFHLRHEHDTFYYERRASPPGSGSRISSPAPVVQVATPSPVLPEGVSWLDAIAQSSQRIDQLTRGVPSGVDRGRQGAAQAPVRPEEPAAPASRIEPAMQLVERERYQDALALLSGAGATSDPDALLLRATLLVINSDAATAEAVCEEILDLDELHAGAHYVLALCREHRGDRDGAVDHGRMAVHLDPRFAMPRVHLGLLARRSGDLDTARREFERALELLEREDAGRIVLFGGGFGREGLIRLCRGELQACKGGDS